MVGRRLEPPDCSMKSCTRKRRSGLRSAALRLVAPAAMAATALVSTSFVTLRPKTVFAADGRASAVANKLALHATAVADVADDVVELLADDWRDEAERCWAPQGDAPPKGFIAEFMEPEPDPEGVSEAAIEAVLHRRGRPWKFKTRPAGSDADGAPQLSSAPTLNTHEDEFIYYYSGKQAADDGNVRKKDLGRALAYLRGAEADTTLLDLGCGDGWMGIQLLHTGKFKRVIAADTAWRQLETTRRSAEDAFMGPHEGFLVARADAQNLPFSEASIDAVWWGLGMHIVDDAPAALKSILRVLRPGGRVLATTIASRFTAKQLQAMWLDAGFAQVQVGVPRHGIYFVKAVRA
eukprot:TRINITY_DN23427_c0_g1_i1.p1 TRINITY_DN23427_c0_g1~~TRINITY_DN23427_c0_g1_i1.p1  ORF type:complete len:350 (+),score=80.78 TRINITY_DN23427_c0_g1_i1:65-1114(+)